MTILKQGSRGEAVKQVQKALHLYPDGIFGALTTEAVRKFQRDNGLTADGIVGPATLAKLITIRWKKSRRRIDGIVVHCTATREGQNLTVDDIRRMHTAPVSKGGRGWSDIGYHYIVTLDGLVHDGRPVDIAGAHVSGYNAHTIGVVYVGGLENRKNPKTGKYDIPKDTRTEAQKNALLSLLMELRRIYPTATIKGHRDYSPDKNGNGIIEPKEWIKSCPCFDAATEYRRI